MAGGRRVALRERSPPHELDQRPDRVLRQQRRRGGRHQLRHLRPVAECQSPRQRAAAAPDAGGPPPRQPIRPGRGGARAHKAWGFNVYAFDPRPAGTPYAPEYGNYAELGYRVRGDGNAWNIGGTVFYTKLRD